MNEQQIKKALERIELQVKCNWWDSLMYFCGVILGFLTVISIFLFLPLIILFGFMLFIFCVIVIQIAEYFQKKNVRRYYKK